MGGVDVIVTDPTVPFSVIGAIYQDITSHGKHDGRQHRLGNRLKNCWVEEY